MIPQQRKKLNSRTRCCAFNYAVVVSALIGWSLTAGAQSDDVAPKFRAPYLQEGVQPENNYGRQAETGQGSVVEAPYSRVFKDTDGIDLFRGTGYPLHHETRVGQAGATMQGSFLSGSLGLPFVNPKFNIDHAQIKLANFYVDIRALTASFLYSDNVDQSEFRRTDGELMSLRLDLAVFAPITERFRIGAAGSIFYLPIQNRVGFSLYGSTHNLTYGPVFQTQVAYDMNIGNWEIVISDDFRAVQIPYGVSLSYSYFEGDEPARVGRYSYNTTGQRGDTRVFEDRSPYGSFDAGFVEMVNEVGGHANRLLPTETRVQIGASHSDYWYIGGKNFYNLPSTGERAYITLNSERDNLRFKPFAGYYVSRYDYNTTWGHEVIGGIQGPVTENIHFFGSAGYRWTDINQNRTVWRISVSHQMTPITSHSITYSRDITEPDRDLSEQWLYQLSQVLGDGLTAQLYGSRLSFEDLDHTGTGSQEWRAGLRFIYRVSPKTTLMAGPTYRRVDYDNVKAPDFTQWAVLFQASHKFSPSLQASLQYQFNDRISRRRGDSYYENFATISVTKYF